ncbi:phage portal protein [Sporosarcina koreensis]|uniref:phage portal protein n=1 Tax=Sporosarcina koreensis TaxID=334735 RepID=UPI000758D503|nr:phage portal protein [Sporosarcina koreensis]
MAFLKTGEQFPPQRDIPRLLKYARMERIYDGDVKGIYDRATALMQGTPHVKQLDQLYIAVNLIDVLTTKPADLLVGEGITIESKYDDESPEQKALNRIVRENDTNALIYESIIGAGIRGDAWLRTSYDNRDDSSEIRALGLEVPGGLMKPEPVIEAVPAQLVFPELAKGSRKKFKAVNIAAVEYTAVGDEVIPCLNVERHLPGWIIYEKYKLRENGVATDDGVNLPMYIVDGQVTTGREEDAVYTGVAEILVKHIPYKAKDSGWQGVGNIEKIETVLRAINDRLVQIDYILWKHSDPHMYGPDITDEGGAQKLGGGIYIPMNPDDKTPPGYLTWNSQLEGAFKQLDYLLSIVFQMTETPQWLFGTTITQDKGGTGTSHSDGRAIQMRLLPILSKVNRIKIYVEKAFKDVLYAVQCLEIYANEEVDGFEWYEPQYPKIVWNSPIPRDAREEAEIASLRTGGKPTLDVHSAVKRLDGFDDEEATKIIGRIGEDDGRVNSFVDASIFNTETAVTDDGE